MLNELYKAAEALESRHVPIVVPHSSVEPMGKSNLLLIQLDAHGNPCRVSFLPREDAGKLVRVVHGSKGSSFPGFNLPLPLRVVSPKMNAAILKQLVESQRSKASSVEALVKSIGLVLSETAARTFGTSQIDQFFRSMQELVGWLKADFAESGPELVNFRRLVDVVASVKLMELGRFTKRLSVCIRNSLGTANRDELILFAEILFGKTHLPKCKDEVASGAYWNAKGKADNDLQTPVFMDVAVGDSLQVPVADPRTSRFLNDYLLRVRPPDYDVRTRYVPKPVARRRKVEATQPNQAVDAYTGKKCVIPNKFPEPKLAVIGNTRLFSNNTTEANCFYRYGLGDTETIKTSSETAEKMAGALFTLAGDDLALIALGGRPSVGKTCRGIPGNRGGKQDLLIAYLEDEPDASDPYVELFGNEAETYDAADFAASTKVVLDSLEGRVAANPNQRIRLIAIAAIDTANKQVSLNRDYTVREVLDAAKSWQVGAANCPPMSLQFFDKQTNKSVFRDRTVPSPLETAIVLNKVWASNAESGFRNELQRIMSVSDAYDIFLAPDSIRNAKVQAALCVVLNRMRAVFIRAATFKVTREWRELDVLQKRRPLSEPARWQVLKAVALIGIFLQQQGKKHEVFMKEAIYQVGRLLALADSLHFQYCKYVRTSEEKRKAGKVDAPSELLGNALFNAALDNPVVALGRLAERIRPYKGWADTYSGENAGLAHWFVRQMAECEKLIDLSSLPKRVEDMHKAQLILGYLSDHAKSENDQ
jgi:hypothetical protein